jgi:hypothetical protein
VTQEARTKDFSRERPRVFLTVDGQEYDAKPALSLPMLQAVQGMQRRMKDPDADRVAEFSSMFTVLLKAESSERFTAKLKDEENPLDFEQLGEMISWLMEQFSGRPTGELSGSPDGSSAETTGMPSTDGVSPSV